MGRLAAAVLFVAMLGASGCGGDSSGTPDVDARSGDDARTEIDAGADLDAAPDLDARPDLDAGIDAPPVAMPPTAVIHANPARLSLSMPTDITLDGSMSSGASAHQWTVSSGVFGVVSFCIIDTSPKRTL